MLLKLSTISYGKGFKKAFNCFSISPGPLAVGLEKALNSLELIMNSNLDNFFKNLSR